MSRDKRLEQLIADNSGAGDVSLYEELKKHGYAPNRARYIAEGSPYGNNRKSMKRWLLEQKNQRRK